MIRPFAMEVVLSIVKAKRRRKSLDAYRLSGEERTNINTAKKMAPEKRTILSDLIDDIKRRLSNYHQHKNVNVDHETAWKATALKSNAPGATLDLALG